MNQIRDALDGTSTGAVVDSSQLLLNRDRDLASKPIWVITQNWRRVCPICKAGVRIPDTCMVYPVRQGKTSRLRFIHADCFCRRFPDWYVGKRECSPEPAEAGVSDT